MTATPTCSPVRARRRLSVASLPQPPTAPTRFVLSNPWRTPLILACAVGAGGLAGAVLSVFLFHTDALDAVAGLAAVVALAVVALATAHGRFWRTAPMAAFKPADLS